MTFPGYAETLPNGSLSRRVITIKSVELKNNAGEWFTVIEPDRRVELAKEEPGLSFFNNGRVPEGAYVNFRLTLSGSGVREISAYRDFQKPLALRKGSFVGVWVSLDVKEAICLSKLSVVVDEDTRNLAAVDLHVQSKR